MGNTDIDDGFRIDATNSNISNVLCCTNHFRELFNGAARALKTKMFRILSRDIAIGVKPVYANFGFLVMSRLSDR